MSRYISNAKSSDASDPNFSGPEYEPERDHARLKTQHERIRDLMLDGNWRTIREISHATGDPENSIQAQLRHMRKPRFGGFIVTKERCGNLYGYRARARRISDPPYQGGKSAKNQARRADAMEALLVRAIAHLRDDGGLFSLIASKELQGELDGL